MLTCCTQSGLNGRHRVAALCTNTGNQQRHGWRQFAHTRNLLRVSRAHHQTQLTVLIPFALGQLRNMFKQAWRARHIFQTLCLQIITAGVRCTAQQKCAFAMAFQIRLNRIKAHEWRQSDGIRTVTLKSFNGVLLSGAADVAALGIQNHWHRRSDLANVRNQLL